jgi:hypothetical protein
MKLYRFAKEIITLIFIIGFLPIPHLASSNEAIDPLQEVQKTFKSIEVKIGDEISIEFCPDNTCDLFTASKGVSLESLKDFAYLYIYFFSDYYELEKWRGNKEPGLIAKQILSKPNYQVCGKETDEDAARCVLRQLGQKGQVKLYFVRYDENKQNIVPKDIFEATAAPRSKK